MGDVFLGALVSWGSVHANLRAYVPLGSTPSAPGLWPGVESRGPCRVLPQWGRARSHGRKRGALPPPGEIANPPSRGTEALCRPAAPCEGAGGGGIPFPEGGRVMGAGEGACVSLGLYYITCCIILLYIIFLDRNLGPGCGSIPSSVRSRCWRRLSPPFCRLRCCLSCCTPGASVFCFSCSWAFRTQTSARPSWPCGASRSRRPFAWIRA